MHQNYITYLQELVLVSLVWILDLEIVSNQEDVQSKENENETSIMFLLALVIFELILLE